MRRDVAPGATGAVISALAPGLALALTLALGACVPDYVVPGPYAAPDDAAVETPDALASPAGPTSETAPPQVEDASPRAGDAGSDGGDTPDEAGLPTSTLGCDLSGRWLVTDREVSTAIGAEEATHEWLYFEMSQTGTQLTVTKGLSCGMDTVGISAASGNVACEKVWPAMQTYDIENGRTGTSATTASGCSVSFARFYEVNGASVPYYQNPNNALPPASQEATSSSPGWQDWDNDGFPGYTLNVTGLTTGQLYISSRRWNEWSGTIDAGSNSFTLADNWEAESDLLGYNGSSLLTENSSATRDNDASLHFVTFARLTPTQATGDDTSVCTSIRSLAPTLAPEASN
jgi:hypothetical protein